MSAATGVIFFGCVSGCFYALSPCGSARWAFDAAAPIFSAPCLFRGGHPAEERVLFTAQSGRLICLETAHGASRWAQPAEVHGHSSPAVDTACGHRAAARSEHRNEHEAQVI